jgi:hypothetical protein
MMPPHRFLYPRQRQIEVLSALYAGGFGVYCEAMTTAGRPSPIYWVSDDPVTQHVFALALLFAALVHAFGIRINGAWTGSPFLRVIGMAVHAAVFCAFFTAAPGSSAAYSYAWVMACMAAGTINAARDCASAVGWRTWNRA